MDIKLISKVFQDGGMIPEYYTCDGKNVSPPLSWYNVPKGTKSFVVIMDDPDAPSGTFVHWVIFNIPINIKDLSENIPSLENLSNGAKQGINDFGKIGYSGPCPPSGIHKYHFKLYAIDIDLKLAPGATKAQIEKNMAGHILSHGKMIGKYMK